MRLLVLVSAGFSGLRAASGVASTISLSAMESLLTLMLGPKPDATIVDPLVPGDVSASDGFTCAGAPFSPMSGAFEYDKSAETKIDPAWFFALA